MPHCFVSVVVSWNTPQAERICARFYQKATQTNGFRRRIWALHRVGVGIILDVVFGHTAEGDERGTTISLKGEGNAVFYHLDANNRRSQGDYSGCKSNLNWNYPIVSLFITTCLAYWVREMRVEGVRLDLASALARGEDGQPMQHPPVFFLH